MVVFAGHMLNFLHMGIQMRDLIKWVIQDTHSKTRNEFDGRGPGDICIYEQDWQQIGDKLSDSLYRLCEGEKSAYPLQCKFYYLFKKFGKTIRSYKLPHKTQIKGMIV